LAFDWGEFLGLADFLAGNQAARYTREAASRSAVSRAYYAAFCHARNHARIHLGYRPTGTAADHTTLRRHLGRHGQFRIARRLDDLRTWRNLCDYEDMVRNLSPILRGAVAAARDVVEALD
jgi:hypothetical protein